MFELLESSEMEIQRVGLTDKEKEFAKQLALIDEDIREAFMIWDREFIRSMIEQTDREMTEARSVGVLEVTWPLSA